MFTGVLKPNRFGKKYQTSRCVDSRPRMKVYGCCLLPSSEQASINSAKMNVIWLITQTATIYRGHGAKNAAIAHTLPISTNYVQPFIEDAARKMWQ